MHTIIMYLTTSHLSLVFNNLHKTVTVVAVSSKLLHTILRQGFIQDFFLSQIVCC